MLQAVALGRKFAQILQFLDHVKKLEQCQKAQGDEAYGLEDFAVEEAADGFHGVKRASGAVRRPRWGSRSRQDHWRWRSHSHNRLSSSAVPCKPRVQPTMP